MKCSIKYKDISLYIDGAFSEKKREAFKAHFAACPLCRKSLKQAESLKASLSKLSGINESPGFDFMFNRMLDDRIAQQESQGLSHVIREKVSRLIHSVTVPVPATVKIAASFILMASLFIGIRSHAMDKMPFVEFSAGNVRIYRQSVNAWVVSKPNLRLKQGDKIRLKDGAVINIASKSRFRARIKDDSMIVISRLRSGLNNMDVDFSVSHGKLLVNTAEGFRGSGMRIYTPSCDAEVVGTAFAVDVSENSTWLGVLEGTVKLVSKPHPLKADMQNPVETFVLAGQKAYTRQYTQTTAPELLSIREWQSMLELYQLVEDPQIMLLIGTGVDRVDDLLGRPALVYIPDSIKRIIPKRLLESIYEAAKSAETGGPEAISENARGLLSLLSQYPDPRYEIEILMFIASHFHYAKDYISALRVLDGVAIKYPDSEMASLAFSGMASIYQNDLRDTRKSNKIYLDLIKSYPNSAEAIRAKEILSAQR